MRGPDTGAMRYLAAALGGFGGLLCETASVRRVGLLCGNTAEASTLVLAVFLLGLGIGGLTLPQWRAAGRRPLRTAALAYGAVALSVLAGDAVLRRLGPLSWSQGLLVVVMTPGLPAVLMGAAFPLLFAGVGGTWRAASLCAANLLGSVAAAALGPNLCLPVLGMTLTQALGAAAYLLAALCALRAGRFERPVAAAGAAAPQLLPGPAVPAVPAVPVGPRLMRAAFLSGVMVLGLEILLLRRLPFFLEGFQPTLAGVLTACLLWLTVGAQLGPVLLRRAFGPRALPAALLLGALALNLGLAEHLVPELSRLRVQSDLGMHARILLAASVAAGPPCLFLGAVIPLAVASVDDPARRAQAAGRLFFWQGAGAVCGALLCGHVLPWLSPAGFFVWAPVVLGLIAVGGTVGTGCRRAVPLAALLVLGAGLGGLSGPGTLSAPAPPVTGSRFDRPAAYRPIEHRTDSTVTASVVYDRQNHSMVLFTDEFRAAYTGPGTSYMRVLGHLPFLLRQGLRDVAVIALGTGTTAAAVCQWPDPERVHVVEISAAVFALVGHFAGDGPVPTRALPAFLRDPRTEVHLTDGRRFLAAEPPRSLDLVTMEPLLPYAPGTGALYSAEFYRLVRSRLRAGGLIVQWVPTHAMPAEFFDRLLGTFAQSFRHTSVWLVDQSTLLVGSEEPHLPDPALVGQRLAALCDQAAATLHEAGITSVDDLEVALVGDDLEAVLGTVEPLVDDRPVLERIGYWSGGERLAFYPDNLARLRELVDRCAPSAWCTDAWRQVRRARLDGLRARAESVFDSSSGTASHAVLDLEKARALCPQSVLLHDEESMALRHLLEREVQRIGNASAGELARRHLERDPGSALLQACAGLGGAQAAAHDAGARAVAIDPTFFTWAPAFLRPLAPPPPHRSPLEDVAELPGAERLAALASGAGVRALALRAAFGVRCARALVSVARDRALSPAEADALREVLDPASLASLTDAVLARGGSLQSELLPLWRRDLPAPRALERWRPERAVDRRAFAGALAGRRGRGACAALAELLMDPVLGVRQAAAGALHITARGRIQFDPQWDESRRRVAAEELRTLHNPPP